MAPRLATHERLQLRIEKDGIGIQGEGLQVREFISVPGRAWDGGEY